MQNSYLPNANNSSSSWIHSENAFKLGVALAFSAVALVLRFAPLPENFACFGALSIFAGFVLRGPARWAIPLVSFFVADCLGQLLSEPGMGFYHLPSMILNYAGFAAMILVGSLASKFHKNVDQDWMPWATVIGTSLVGSISFFLISNLGAWLDPIMGYDRTISGLIRCYWMGLPFFTTTWMSDLSFGVGFYGVYRLVRFGIVSLSQKPAPLAPHRGDGPGVRG